MSGAAPAPAPRGRRILTIAALAAAIAILLIITGPFRRAAAKTPTDVRTIEGDWALRHLHLPEAEQAGLAAAAGDPQAVQRVLSGYFSTRPPPANLADFGIRNTPRTIEDWRAGRLQLGQNAAVPFTLLINWAESGPGTNFQNELHSLRFLTNFIEAYCDSHDPEMLGVVDAVLADWIQKNQPAAPASDRAWFEGAVSKRTLVLTNLTAAYAAQAPGGKIPLATLLALIHQHASFLAQDRTYQPNGNHGMRQDLALLAAARMFPEFTDAASWEATALHRLQARQVQTGFSAEGIWKEHSPSYHHYVMRLIHQINTLASINGMNRDAAFLDDLEAKSQRYLSHVITPAGLFPPVADSAEENIPLAEARSPELLYVLSRGGQGSPPATLDGFYPDAGEAIFRDTWGRAGRAADQAIYINMRASLHPGFDHRHADELSFVMQGLGRWWVLEAGKYSYDRDPMRAFVVSAQAHNGITYNGKAMEFNAWADPANKVWFEPLFVSTPQVAAARAHSTRFSEEGVQADRTFIFLRERQCLLVIDHLHAPRSGAWQSMVHLAPDLAATIAGEAVQAAAPADPSTRLEVITASETPATVRIVRGQADPPLGWYSPEYGSIEPTPVIICDRTAADVLAVTLIRLCDAAAAPVSSLHITQEHDDCTVTWGEGDESIAVKVPAASPLEVAVTVAGAGRSN